MATETLQFVLDEIEEGDAVKEETRIEQDVVDEFLTLEDDGERLVFELGDGVLVIADTESHSKRTIREFYAKLRPLLENIVYEGLEKLRNKISDERRELEKMETANAKLKTKVDPEQRGVMAEPVAVRSGYVVVDASWNRTLFYDKHNLCLWETNKINPVTVFDHHKEAEVAIASTKSYLGGNFAWSTNDYIILAINV